MDNSKTQDKEYNMADEFNLDNNISKEQKHYIEHRVLAQIQWYDQKAISCQKLYKRLSYISIILTSIIPVISLFGEYWVIKVLIALASAIASVLSYVISINTFKELWIQYRSNCELLKSELHKFLNKIGIYNIQDIYKRFDLFCSNCENCFVKEFASWKISQDKDKTN